MTALFDLLRRSTPWSDGWRSAAVFLIVELMTGSGWLLWPAGSAAVVGLVILGLRLSAMPAQAALFAVLTIASTYVGRRLLDPSAARGGHDPNDPLPRLIGRRGQSRHGRSRAAWAGCSSTARNGPPSSIGDGPVAAGGRIEVVALVGGARLKVRAG